ncbi:MAG: hypothetical protein KA248_00995 [Kiritimatiellae bacterium]|nr:hypothetical protein [Kiritimatiellia bacterium]
MKTRLLAGCLAGLVLAGVGFTTGCEDDDDSANPLVIVVTNEVGQVIEVEVPAGDEEVDEEPADAAAVAEGEEEPAPIPVEPALMAPVLMAPADGIVVGANGGMATIPLAWFPSKRAKSYRVKVGGQEHDVGTDLSYIFTGGPGLYAWQVAAVRDGEVKWSGKRYLTIVAL